jgi:hypothetical protein
MCDIGAFEVQPSALRERQPLVALAGELLRHFATAWRETLSDLGVGTHGYLDSGDLFFRTPGYLDNRIWLGRAGLFFAGASNMLIARGSPPARGCS